MKTFIISSVVVLLALGVVWFVYDKDEVVRTGLNLGSYQSHDVYYLDGATASTSPVYLDIDASSATSTMTLSVNNASVLDLNIQQTSASSTNAVIWWTYYFSEDGVDWYPETEESTSGNVVTHNASETIHKWTPGVATAAYTNDHLTDITSKLVKIEFSAHTTSTALYVEAKTLQTID